MNCADGWVTRMDEPRGRMNRRGSDGEFALREEGLEDRREWWRSGTAGVVAIALGTVVVHLVTGWRYGFNRDELMALDDARHLAWGYVQYPPMTAFFGWIALKLFGTSLGGFRFFAGLVQAAGLVLTGLMAKEMGGGKWAQMMAALAGVPFCLGGGALMQYISFDYVCWVLVAYGITRLLGRSDGAGVNARWWLWIGAGIGLGMLAKYTMGLSVAGIVVGVLATQQRRYLKSAWLWGGVLLSLLIFLPNFFWEWKRNFISADFLRFVHERDVREGLTGGFLAGQLELTMLALPLALAGLWFCFADEKRYRLLGWMYVVPLVLLVVMRGRDYYLAPAYPMLYAAGAVWVERRMRREMNAAQERVRWAGIVRRILVVALVLDVVAAAAVALPIAPVNSAWWKMASKTVVVFPEEIGWEEFTQSVAQVWDRLPEGEKARAGILAGNYGEVGALNLYGEKFGLPMAISGVNSSWERGYGEIGPETVVVVGYPRGFLETYFAKCEVGGHVWNQYGVANEETVEDPEIFVCRGLKGNWEQFWKAARKFA
jgi:Dolichyl-phosphate-mannose-protein mannosyltransferase